MPGREGTFSRRIILLGETAPGCSLLGCMMRCICLVLALQLQVIVLDEIEKAHSDFARALLTVFGEYGSSAVLHGIFWAGVATTGIGFRYDLPCFSTSCQYVARMVPEEPSTTPEQDGTIRQPMQPDLYDCAHLQHGWFREASAIGYLYPHEQPRERPDSQTSGLGRMAFLKTRSFPCFRNFGFL